MQKKLEPQIDKMFEMMVSNPTLTMYLQHVKFRLLRVRKHLDSEKASQSTPQPLSLRLSVPLSHLHLPLPIPFSSTPPPTFLDPFSPSLKTENNPDRRDHLSTTSVRNHVSNQQGLPLTNMDA